MGDIKTIKFNTSDTTSIEFSNNIVQKLIYNNHVWEINTDENDTIYIVGLDSGGRNTGTNTLFYKNYQHNNNFYNSGSAIILLSCNKEHTITKYVLGSDGKTWQTPTAYQDKWHTFSYEYIDNLGYILTHGYTSWSGGSGGSFTHKLVIDEGLDTETTFIFYKIADENNYWLLEGDYVTKTILYENTSTPDNINLNYYPEYFESEVDLSKLSFKILDTESGNLTDIENATDIISAFIVNQKDNITINITYSITANTTKQFRKACIVVSYEGDYIAMLYIIQKPNS